MIIFGNLLATVSLLCFAPFAFAVGLCRYSIGMVLVILTRLVDIWTDK